MQRIALTGSTGFIGGHLAKKLRDEDRPTLLIVRKINDTIRSLQEQGADVLVSTLDDRISLGKALDTVDTVIHCAGATKALGEAQYMNANVELTRSLLNVLHGGQRLVFISSQAAAGPTYSHAPLDETAAPRPVSHYGRSKFMAEQAVRSWGGRNDARFVILRPGIVYGPGDRELRRYFSAVKRGIMPLPPRGLTVSVVHVADLVEATLRAAEKAPAGETYFVANDEACTWEAMGESIARALGRTRLLRVRPPEVILRLLAPLADAISQMTGTPSMINSQKILEMRQRRWICSNRKIREQLHWEPRMELDEGIRQTARWYEKHQWI